VTCSVTCQCSYPQNMGFWRADELSLLVVSGSHLLGRSLRLVRALPGGQHALTVLVTDGEIEYVLRQFPVGDDAVVREAEILERLIPLGAVVPRLVAHDSALEQPLIITSAIRGSAPLPTLLLDSIAGEMAGALSAIHALDGTGLRPEPHRPPGGDTSIAERARGEWQLLDRTDRVLSHYDFWCGNALWNGDDLVGIVDWSGARDAPRGVDLAWCRLDLILLGSADAAHTFLTHYERLSGRTVADIALWDVQAAALASSAVETWAPNYDGIDRTALTPTLLRQRLDRWISTL